MITYVIGASIFFIIFILFAIHCEKKAWNNGVCKHCGGKLRYFDSDSQGGRGYCCDNCHYPVWISYHVVDKNYREDK